MTDCWRAEREIECVLRVWALCWELEPQNSGWRRPIICLRLLSLTFARQLCGFVAFTPTPCLHPYFFLIPSECQPLHETTGFFNSLLATIDASLGVCVADHAKTNQNLRCIWPAEKHTKGSDSRPPSRRRLQQLQSRGSLPAQV